ncbi:MAG: hypothetical protein RBT56_12220, partial [Ignavibacteriaceae bacterium]|nr:hypothetical protein [Ignavibacteriaceae bacterium]
WKKNGSLGFAKVRLPEVSGQVVWRAKPNVPLAGGLKLFLINADGKKIKKHRVGNECMPVQ